MTISLSEGCRGNTRTIRMPDFAQELHFGRTKWIVFGKLEFGGEDTSLKGCVFGPLDQGFPGEDVVFGDGTSGYAVRWGGGEEAVFVEEPFGSYGCGHGLGNSRFKGGVCRG